MDSTTKTIDDLPSLGTYQHYKGGLYKLTGFGKNEATLEWMCIYEPLYAQPDAKVWLRPVKNWFDIVEWEGKPLPRFTKVGD